MDYKKDFLGKDIFENCYVAYPGVGNVKAEYGMILYRVIEFDHTKKKIKAQRLDVIPGFIYADTKAVWHKLFLKRKHLIDPKVITPSSGTPYQFMISMIESSLENTNKLAIVDPPQIVKDLFDAIYSNDANIFQRVSGSDISSWILGSTHAINFLQ